LSNYVRWSKQFQTFGKVSNVEFDAEEQTRRVQGAVEAITKSGRSLYTLAVLSGKVSAVEWVDKFVREHFNESKVRRYHCLLL